MYALPFIALCFGGLLGLRFNVWALLVCLGATVPAVSGPMLLSHGVTSAMFATFVVVTSMQIGYLAGTYSIQTVMHRRAMRSVSIPGDR